MAEGKELTEMTFTVRVSVDPTDSLIVEAFHDSNGTFSVVDIVSAEIESNLESVSYIRRVSIE